MFDLRWSVCLCVCAQNIAKSMNGFRRYFTERRGVGLRTSRLDFGGDPHCSLDPAFLDPEDYDHDVGIFKGFFIYYCDSYRQPKIKHNSRTFAPPTECCLTLHLSHLSARDN